MIKKLIYGHWEQYVMIDGEYKWGMDLPETLEAIKMAKQIFTV